MEYKGKALTIAGSDSGGGAGIQADLKTFQAFGIFGACAITSVTAQNTLGVRSIHDVPSRVVADQIDVVMEDIQPDSAKTGMLSNQKIVKVVVGRVKKHNINNLVVDPVMVAKSGAPLLTEDARDTLVEELLPVAFLVSPNVQEAQIISGVKIKNIEDAKEAAHLIHARGAKFVLLKGGHLPGERAVDILFDGERYRYYSSPKFDTKNTHGTGCTFSSAITAGLAKKMSVDHSVQMAKDYITRAIKQAPSRIGKGHGPLYHWVVHE